MRCDVQIKIEILDVNDNPPVFPQRRLRQRIAESTDPQSSGIAVPPATDPDAGRNAIHKYEIYSTTDQFILDARHTADGGVDLRLLLRQPLDRELEDRSAHSEQYRCTCSELLHSFGFQKLLSLLPCHNTSTSGKIVLV